MRYGIFTSEGLKRRINEDYYGIIKGDENLCDVFIIADGMGGHQAGEVASKMAVVLSIAYMRDSITKDMTKEEIEEKLREIIKKVNGEIYKVAEEDPTKYGMGTTLVIAVVTSTCFVVANIGDSRLYILESGKLKRITTDHSYVEELKQKGSISEEDAKTHPRRNLLTRVVGYFKDVDADIYECDRNSTDKVLMCTDGLVNMVSDQKIEEILKEEDDLQKIARTLVTEANKNGGIDNTTVIVFGDEVAVNER